MKTAKVIPIEFEVYCPKCSEIVVDPNYYSHRWTTDDYKAGQVIKCHCGEKFKLPKVIPGCRL